MCLQIDIGSRLAEGIGRSIFWHFQDMKTDIPVPTFALYGEDSWQSPAGFGHIELIAERSSLHGWTIAAHRHDRAVQFLLVLSGEARVTLDDELFELAGPAFIVVPVDVVHGFRFTPGTQGYVLTLGQHFLTRVQAPDDPLGHLLTGGGHGRIEGAALTRITNLAAELQALAPDTPVTDPAFDAMAEALVRSLAGHETTPPQDRRLALFRHLVETHLAEHRSLDFYASSIGTTVRTLTRLCQRHLGAPPQALINRRLALEALRLLRYTGTSVSGVATRLGFEDVSYFSRFYLRATGRRPSAERETT